MINFLLSKPNKLVEHFLARVFKGCSFDSKKIESTIFVLTESHEISPPDFVPAGVIDCHLGARLSANPELSEWFNKFDGKKISFNPSRKNFQFRDLRLLSLPETCEGTDSSSRGTLIILPEAEFDEDLVEAVKNHCPDVSIVAAESIESLERLSELVSKYATIVNPTLEVDFPLIELLAYQHRKSIVTTQYGCVYDYLGNHAYYFIPDNHKSYASLLRVAGFQPSDQITLGGDLFSQLQMDFGYLNSEESVLEKVELLIVESRLDEAKSLIKNGLEQFNDSAVLRRAYGIILMSEGSFDEAKTWLLESYILDPNNSRTLCALGMVYANSGLVNKAKEFLVKSFHTSDQPLIPLFKLIELAYRDSDFSEAISCLEEYLAKTNFENLDLIFTLAGLHYKAHNFKESLKHLNSVLERNPNYEAAAQLKEMVLEAIKTQEPLSEPAQEIVEEIRVTVEKDIEAILNKVEALKKSGDYLSAFKLLSDNYNEELDPVLLEKMRFLMMEIKVLMWDLDFYTSNFEFFEQQYSNHPRWLSIKGTVDLINGNLTEAERHFKEAVELNPKMDVPWAGLALVSELKEDFETAYEYYLRSLKINPLNLRAVLGLSEICLRSNKPHEAIGWVERFMSECPECEELKEVYQRLLAAKSGELENNVVG